MPEVSIKILLGLAGKSPCGQVQSFLAQCAALSSPIYVGNFPVVRIAHVYWRDSITCSEYRDG